MDEATLARYRSHIGKHVEYYSQPKALSQIMGSSTKRCWGKLVEIKYKEKKARFYAKLHRLDGHYRLQRNSAMELTVDKVPIEHIILRTTGTPSQRRGESSTSAAQQWTSSSSSLQYGQEKYNITTVEGVKIGDEVVWLRETASASASPLIGKITWIGGKILVTGQRDVVAVVQFDQPTSTLPRYLQYPPANRNIVSLDELLHLHIWLDTYNQTSSVGDTESMENMPSSGPVSQSNVAVGNLIDLEEDNDDTGVGTGVSTSASYSNFLSWVTEKQGNTNTNASTFPAPNAYTHGTPNVYSPGVPAFTVPTGNPGMQNGKQFGIQGFNNSCYMDATIFSLFAFNNSLDGLLSAKMEYSEDVKKALLAETVKTLLKFEIINPLREKCFVSGQSMRKLRDVLVNVMGQRYANSFVDVEEFIYTFLNLINAPELLTYNYGGKDYMHQIILPTTWQESMKREYLTLQTLLETSFSVSQVKLTEIPKSAFIIKLPVTNGKLIPCNAVIPNMNLDISRLVEGNGQVLEWSEITEMRLHAVICLRSNHFVTFVCMNHKDAGSRWVFMDSKPTTSNPEVHILDEISSNLRQAERDIDFQRLTQSEPECNGFKLFRDAYICIYVPA